MPIQLEGDSAGENCLKAEAEKRYGMNNVQRFDAFIRFTGQNPPLLPQKKQSLILR
jgi:hypothetical protein